MAQKNLKTRSLLFDANPLVQTKTGVGYYLENIIVSLSANRSGDLELTGHYFNFFGRKHVGQLVSSPQVHYIKSQLFPTKLLGLLRRVGIELPLELFTRKRSDITLFSNFVSLPTISNTMSALVIYDVSFMDCPQYVSDKNGAFLRKWVPKSISRADVIITISQFTKQRIVELFKVSPDKIYITPVPPLTHQPADHSISDRFGIKKDYLLFVGTIEPRKNLNTLLDAYEKLPGNLQDKYQLVIAGGKGWKDEGINARIEELMASGKQVIKTGYISDAEKAALYENASLCVQPSHYEGFGMPILEAMSYGKPVICSDIPVFQEIAGTSATFFDKEDSASLAKTITDLLSDNQKLANLSEKSIKTVATYKTWSEVTDGLCEFLLSALKH